MPGKTSFQNRWLELPEFRGWLSAVPSDKYSAYCTVCKKSFDVTYSGLSNVKQHAKGIIHRSRIGPLREGTQTTLPFTSKNSSSSSNQNPVTVDENQNSSNVDDTKNRNSVSTCACQVSVNKFVTRKEVIKAEIIWALSRIVCHESTRTVDYEGKLFPIMFPDSQIARQYAMKKDKAAYVITYGMGEYFHEELLKKLSASFAYALSIDESLNKISKKCQLDMIVRFWCNEDNKLETRYLASLFLEGGTAEQVFSALIDTLNKYELKLCRMIQLATDGPNVNLKLFRILREFLLDSSNKEDENKSMLCDVGTCPVHTVHNAYKNGHKKCGWKVNEFLKSSYFLFCDFPKRRADFIRLSGNNQTQFPLKFCHIRWLENIPALKRALHVLEPLKKYFEGVEDPPKSKNFDFVRGILKDKLLPAKIEFMISIAEDFYDFLLKFQTDNPVFPLLYEDLHALTTRIGRRFLKKVIFDAKISPENLKQESEVDIGFGARKYLKPLKMSAVHTFQSECRTFLTELFITLMKKCPIKNSFVRAASAFDPQIMIDQKKCERRITDLITAFVENSVLEGSVGERIKTEYLHICTAQKTYLKSFVRHSPNCQLDDFLMGVNQLQDVSNDFRDFLKIILTFFSSNAAVERSFSVNKECLVENLEDDSLVAQRRTYDALKEECNFQLDKLNITTSMIQHFKNAGTKRNEALAKKRKIKAEKENLKNNEKTELLILKAKKQKLEESHAEHLNMLDSNIKYLENKLKK